MSDSVVRKKRRVSSGSPPFSAKKPSSLSPASPSTKQLDLRMSNAIRIKENFHLVLPECAHIVWELAQEIEPTNATMAFATLDIQLVGPFDCMANKQRVDEDEPWSNHYRYKFDPPEVVTMFKSVKDENLHFGYYRDAPSREPTMVVSNNAGDDGKFVQSATTLIEAMLYHATAVTTTTTTGANTVAITTTTVAITTTTTTTVANTVATGASTVTTAPGLIVERLNKALKQQQQQQQQHKNLDKKREKCVDTTLSTLGIVVPYNKETEVGWRPLNISDKKLHNYFTKLLKCKENGTTPDFSQLDKLIAFANISNDEGDYGQALKLGLDLLSFDVVFDKDARGLLAPTYSLLSRDEFSNVITAHTNNGRRRDDQEPVLKLK